MQLPSHIAQPVDERLFDVHVDVLQLHTQRELPGGNLLTDRVERRDQLLAFVA